MATERVPEPGWALDPEHMFRTSLLVFEGLQFSQASPVALTDKNSPAMQETQVQSLGWKEPLEKEMATHSSILAWRIPWTEEPSRLHGVAKSQTQLKQLHFHFIVQIVCQFNFLIWVILLWLFKKRPWFLRSYTEEMVHKIFQIDRMLKQNHKMLTSRDSSEDQHSCNFLVSLKFFQNKK